MITKFFERLTSLIEKTIVIAIILLLWEIAPRLKWVDGMYLPPFSEVLLTFIKMVESGNLLTHVIASLQRAFLGLMLAVAIAIPLGFFVGWFQKIHKFLAPILQICRNIPTPALLPVFIIFFGLTEISKIAIIFCESFWPILLNTIAGVKSVDGILIKDAKSMGVSKFQLFTKVIFPWATPFILAGFRLSASSAMLILIVAEMLGAKHGLGLLISNSGPKPMYVGIITISLIGLTINYLINVLEKYLTRWKEEV